MEKRKKRLQNRYYDGIIGRQLSSLHKYPCGFSQEELTISGRIFQNAVLQFKETTDRTIGVIDAEGTVIACSELTGIGKKFQ